MTTYEYTVLEVPVKRWFLGGKVDTQALTDKLNELGRAGWQVTAMTDTNMSQGASRNLFVILQKEKADAR